MFATEHGVQMKGAVAMWSMALAMTAGMVLGMVGLMALVMVFLHRKPHRASAHQTRGQETE